MKVYLSGTIGGLTFEEANSWREKATERLAEWGVQTLNPLRGRLFETGPISMDVDATPNEIVTRDLYDISKSDMLLVYLPNVSIGTICEIWQAYMVDDKPVILVTDNRLIKDHPWIQVACTKIFLTIDEACAYIGQRWVDDDPSMLPEIF